MLQHNICQVIYVLLQWIFISMLYIVLKVTQVQRGDTSVHEVTYLTTGGRTAAVTDELHEV